MGKSDSLFGTYMFDNGKTEGPDSFNNNTIGTLSRRQATALEETHLFGTQMANTARLGFSRVVSQAAKKGFSDLFTSRITHRRPELRG